MPTSSRPAAPDPAGLGALAQIQPTPCS
jgi:hypothetical protein